MRFAAIAFSVIVSAMVSTSAYACVPINYDSSSISLPSMADDMVAEAASVELMRVSSRSPIFAHRQYAEYHESPVFRFHLSGTAVLKGRSLGELRLDAVGLDSRVRNSPDWHVPRRDPLWWTGEQGYNWLQRTVLISPKDPSWATCLSYFSVDADALYLVFRNEDGSLLSPGYYSNRRRAHPRQRPVMEIIGGDSDPWLVEVRRAVREAHD